MATFGFCGRDCGAACPQCIAAATALIEADQAPFVFADAALLADPPPPPPQRKTPKELKTPPVRRWGAPSLGQPPPHVDSEAEATAHALVLQKRRERYAARTHRPAPATDTGLLDGEQAPGVRR